MKPITEIESRERSISPANDSISPDERRRREEAASFALANVRLEGFEPSQQTLEQTRRFINGEIQLSELVQFVPNAASAPRR
jgi:Tfp pilus assembly protein PilP